MASTGRGSGRADDNREPSGEQESSADRPAAARAVADLERALEYAGTGPEFRCLRASRMPVRADERRPSISGGLDVRRLEGHSRSIYHLM